MRRWALRLLVIAASLLLGAAVALCTVLLHDDWWGLLLGLATTGATLVALPGGWARMPFGVGWAAMTAYCLQKRPEGDFLISQDLAGWTVVVAAVVVLIVSMIGARRADPASRSAAPPSAEDLTSR